jgi:hypothetical protein
MEHPRAAGPNGTTSDANVPSRGQLLYENHCMVCHESQLHVREDRRATSGAAVEDQVRRWSGEQKLEWDEEDVSDVTGYLLHRYYRFGADSLRK